MEVHEKIVENWNEKFNSMTDSWKIGSSDSVSHSLGEYVFLKEMQYSFEKWQNSILWR